MENSTKEPVKVHNKDILLLADITRIMQEIREIERRKEWQREQLYSIRAQRISGMPGGGSAPRGLDEGFAALSELDDEHNQLLKSYVRTVRKADSILENIESATMRAFVRMKYVSGASDVKIRDTLGISRRGFSRAKECIESAPCMAAVKWHERYILDDSE